MRIDLKPLNEQVVVVLGASSGIGRASAESHRVWWRLSFQEG
jgi:hypothetical protein